MTSAVSMRCRAAVDLRAAGGQAGTRSRGSLSVAPRRAFFGSGRWWVAHEGAVDETRLIKQLRRGDEAAFALLVRQNQGRIFSLCYRMLGNAAEAEDIAQDVFVKSFLAIDGFRGDSQIGTWLYRIAINLCKNRLKYLGRRRYRSNAPLDKVPEGAYELAQAGTRTVGEQVGRPDEILEGNRAESRIQRALAEVEPAYRELLVLRDIEGLTYQEIMVITELAEGTVKSRLHRARAALRRAYEAQEDEK